MSLHLSFTEFVWQCFGTSCYNFNTIKIRKNYADAKAHCEGLGGHVVAIETEEEGVIINDAHQAKAGKIYSSHAIFWLQKLQSIFQTKRERLQHYLHIRSTQEHSFKFEMCDSVTIVYFVYKPSHLLSKHQKT